MTATNRSTRLHTDNKRAVQGAGWGWLSRSDQTVVAVFVGVALLLILVGTWGLTDVDQQPAIPMPYRIDINTASWPELAQLPGIGETLARRIVASRETEGLFRRPADLRRVRGVGPVVLERILPYLEPWPNETTVTERSAVR
jgi:competence protein ComEA